jgi:hypothetical protein
MPLLALILVIASVAALKMIGLPDWLSNWPAMSAAGGLLLILLRAPAFRTHLFLGTVLKLATSICLLAGFSMLLNWSPLWSVLVPFGLTRNQTGLYLIIAACLGWSIAVFWILFPQLKGALRQI